jgi:hypothetical protein
MRLGERWTEEGKGMREGLHLTSLFYNKLVPLRVALAMIKVPI